jgi:hypothetical protein
MRLLLTFAFILSYALTVSPQDNKRTQGDPTFETTAKQKIKRFKNSQLFYVRYDEFRDWTTVRVGPFNIGGTDEYFMSGTIIWLYGAFRFSGQRIQNPAGQFFPFYITLGYRSQNWMFLNSRDVYALVDGERFELGEILRSSNVDDGSVSETVAIPMDAAMFAKIANGKTVEMKFGEREMTLKDEHLKAFRNLLELAAQ